MEPILLDVRYSLRMFARNPGFTAVAVLILALGIGANTAIFSVVDAVLLRPLPVVNPESVVVIHNQLPKLNLPHTEVSALQYLDYTAQADVFESTAALTTQNFNLTGVDAPERLQAVRATASFLPMLGTTPVVGRLFTQEEDKAGAGHVALLSNHLWKRLLNPDSALLGRMLQLDGQGYQVIGVMPADIEQLYPNADVWIPMAFTAGELSEERRGSLVFGMLARLKRGVSVRQAQEVMTGVARNTSGMTSDLNIEVRPLLEEKVGDVRKPLYVLLGAVGVVLLIGCANIASLLLARASGRFREMAIRAAVGARRFRLIQQLLTESLLLAVIGGGFGATLARWGVRALLRIAPANLPRLSQVHLNSRVLWFTLGVSVACGIIFGLVPAFAASKTDLAESLNESGRGSSAGPARHRLRGFLVIGEVALGFALLISAGLLVRSFARLLQVRPGFNPQNVLTMRLSLPRSAYAGNAQVKAFYNSVLERIAVLPGVKHAAAAYQPPFMGGDNSVFSIRNYQPGPGEPPPHADYLYVTADYFNAIGIPLLKGRSFTQSDLQTNGLMGPGATAVIDEALARRFWPDRDPIGAEIGWGGDRWATIVGVVGTVLHDDLTEESKGTFYFPAGWIPFSSLVVRTASDPQGMARAVSDQVHAVDPNQPVYDVKTMDERLAGSLDQRRFAVVLLAVFAGIALLLAAIGLYGVISFMAAQRAHEIGIRMAMGAARRDILGMVARHALALTVGGLGIGLVLSLAASQYLSSLLYGIASVDAVTFGTVSSVLVIVAGAAGFIPAWRAARIDPMAALRCQ